MENLHKYGKKGVLTVANVRRHIEQVRFPRYPIGEVAGIDRWFIEFRIGRMRQIQVILPILVCADAANKKMPEVRTFFRIIQKDGSTTEPAFNGFSCSPLSTRRRMGTIGIPYILNEQHGVLNDNGSLTIEYGIHVRYIYGEYGIGEFNFFEKNSDFMEKVFYYTYSERLEGHALWGHKQFVREREINGYLPVLSRQDLAKSFQIAHGVRLQILSFETVFNLMRYAEDYSLPNVKQYVDQKLVEWECPVDWIGVAMKYNLNHWMASLMRKLKNKKQLKKVFEDTKLPNIIEWMRGEALKKCVMYFFENSN